MNVIFDVKHLYYLPQYLPVLHELKARGVFVRFVFYRDIELNSIIDKVINDEQLQAVFVDNWAQALAFYLAEKADWLVFGNKVDNLDELHSVSKTALMQHGIGPKACYYDVSESATSVRFVEGQHRLQRLLARFPNNQFVDVGYAKLDPIFSKQKSEFGVARFGLDQAKPTILYAPTFYPSSLECFPDDFPARFPEYNFLIKPHFFSLTKTEYVKHRKLLNKWKRCCNAYVASVEDYNLLPFMDAADLMISDASSAIFEFAALNKPVLWCDFYKLRWSYRGIFSFRLKNRLDEDIKYFHKVSEHCQDYKQVERALMLFAEGQTPLRPELTSTILELAGAIDGLASKRIADYMVNL